MRSIAPGRDNRARWSFEPLPDLETCRAEWSAVAERSDNIFLSWEWASTWWRHFGTGGRFAATGCRRPDGTSAAILPLYVARHRGLRVLRFIGHGVGDELGPVCEPGDRLRAAAAIRRGLEARIWGEDVFAAELVPAEPPWCAALGGRVVRREPSPTLRLEARSWADYLATRSANLRQQIRRTQRRLRRDHAVRFRLVRDPARLDRDLTILFDLHRRRWKGRSVAFSRGREAFHRDFARVALERDWLRLRILELDGRPAAALLGFSYRGAESYYQAGRDPGLERESVGLVLLSHSIRRALEGGAREYRLLRGGERLKQRLANCERELTTVVRGHGVRGRLALAAVALTEAIPAAGRPAIAKAPQPI